MARRSAKVAIRSYRRDQDRHDHGFHQMVLPLQGNLEIDIAGQGGRIGQNIAAFIPAGASHVFSATGDNQFAILDFPEQKYLGGGLAVLSERLGQTLYFTMPQSLSCLTGFLAAQAAGSLEGEAAQSWGALLSHSLTGAAPPRWSPQIARAVAFIADNLQGPIRMAALARAAGLSERSLNSRFRAEIGQSPHGYVMERRAGRALDLLGSATHSLDEIAFQCGYGDRAAMSKALRQLRGVTPAAYRRTRLR